MEFGVHGTCTKFPNLRWLSSLARHFSPFKYTLRRKIQVFVHLFRTLNWIKIERCDVVIRPG